MLHEAGAEIDSPCDNYVTPTQLAALEGSYESLKYLIEHGADVESQNTHGYRPLSATGLHGRIRCAQLLLRNGAETEPSSVEASDWLAAVALKPRYEDCGHKSRGFPELVALANSVSAAGSWVKYVHKHYYAVVRVRRLFCDGRATAKRRSKRDIAGDSRSANGMGILTHPGFPDELVREICEMWVE